MGKPVIGMMENGNNDVAIQFIDDTKKAFFQASFSDNETRFILVFLSSIGVVEHTFPLLRRHSMRSNVVNVGSRTRIPQEIDCRHI